jgi:hypothetical protein
MISLKKDPGNHGTWSTARNPNQSIPSPAPPSPSSVRYAQVGKLPPGCASSDMHCKTLIITAFFAEGALSTCRKPGWGMCEWRSSTPPFCGATSYNLGERDPEGKTLRAWTKCHPIEHLCNEGIVGMQCCHDYGKYCVFGYKRLWCD